MHEDPTPARDLRACHLVKLHVSVVRHLAEGHDVRFDRPCAASSLPSVTTLHKDLHGSTVLWPDLPHVHALAK